MVDKIKSVVISILALIPVMIYMYKYCNTIKMKSVFHNISSLFLTLSLLTSLSFAVTNLTQ